MRKQFTIIFVLLCLSCSGQNSPSFEETMEWLKGKFEVPLLRQGSATYPSFNYDGCNIIYSHRYRDNINPGSYVNGLIMTWKFSLKDIKSFKVYYDKGMFYNKVQFVVFNDRPLIVNSDNKSNTVANFYFVDLIIPDDLEFNRIEKALSNVMLKCNNGKKEAY